MDKPAASFRRIHPGTLMRAVDRCISLMHYNFVLIRSINGTRTKARLPSIFHSAGRHKNIIISIFFIHLRPLCGRSYLFSVENQFWFRKQTTAVGIYFHHREAVFHSTTTFSIGKNHICLPIFIPERTWIDPSLRLTQKIQFKFPIGISGAGYQNALIY